MKGVLSSVSSLNEAAPSSDGPRSRRLSIVFVIHDRVRRNGDRYLSSMASIRYRACIPGQVLADWGHEIRLLPAGEWTVPSAASAHLDADVVVIAKSFHRVTERLAQEARRRGAAVIVDLCDNHFDNPQLAEHQRVLADLADLLVVSTSAMGQVVHSKTGRDSWIVADPYEGPQGEPRFAPAPCGPLKLVWFGHPLNLDTVTASLPSLIALGERSPLTLRLVTMELPGLTERLRTFNERFRRQLEISLVPWSLETTWLELAGADLAIIPSLENDRKIVKSPNRVVECLRAGRLPVAFGLPSYLPFAPYAWLGDNVADGIAWAVAHPESVVEKVRGGQAFVAREFAAARSAQSWENAFRAAMQAREHASAAVGQGNAVDVGATRAGRAPCGSAAIRSAEPAPQARSGPSAASATSPDTPLRLNLGCGDKILPGYVNVDVVGGRLGRSPDVICDIRELSPFGDDSVDEVLAVHVVEHIWRWEVVDLLREWFRVLKPKGRMVLECPNLLYACQELVRHPHQGTGPGPEGERTMWVLYGDPRWQDPYMCHRWGYTPESLAQVMRQAGLVNVRQEPAQYKMREPRDMRVVGEKPERDGASRLDAP